MITQLIYCFLAVLCYLCYYLGNIPFEKAVLVLLVVIIGQQAEKTIKL